VRVYLPATSVQLAELRDTGALGPPPLTAFAVTPALREWYNDDDPEALEYAATTEAARGSLRLLDADPAAVRRRIVIAAELPDGDVAVRDDLDRGVVQLNAAVPLSAIASVHADDADAEATVSAAADAILSADLGGAEAQERVDDAEGFELAWYASQEIARLLDSFSVGG
jgi:hypothetical protein